MYIYIYIIYIYIHIYVIIFLFIYISISISISIYIYIYTCSYILGGVPQDVRPCGGRARVVEEEILATPGCTLPPAPSCLQPEIGEPCYPLWLKLIEVPLLPWDVPLSTFVSVGSAVMFVLLERISVYCQLMPLPRCSRVATFVFLHTLVGVDWGWVDHSTSGPLLFKWSTYCSFLSCLGYPDTLGYQAVGISVYPTYPAYIQPAHAPTGLSSVGS